MRLYSEEQPQEAVPHLEAALQEYFVADEECRALCEGPYDYDGYNYLEYNADLFQAITGARASAGPCRHSTCGFVPEPLTSGTLTENCCHLNVLILSSR